MLEAVVAKEAPLAPSVADSRIICRICQKQFSQYTCPRCNCRYCSLQCYKGHSLRCTESFMRENVMEEMQHMQPDDKTKINMLNILKRFHLEEADCDDVDDDNDSSLSEETVTKFLSGEDFGLHDLSPAELKRFRRAVTSGELSKMIKPWEPWWLKPSARTISLSQDGTQLIKVVADQSAILMSQRTSEENASDIPAGPETTLSPLSKLSCAEPSPLLPVHLVDILYSYCFTLRLYNGDIHSDPLGAAMVILNISSILSECHQPETVAEVVGHCMAMTCSPTYKHAGGLPFALGLLDDVINLLSLGNNALICLLCDLQRLIVAGEKMLKKEKNSRTKRNEAPTKLKRAERKLHFFMCWVHEQLQEVFSYTSNLVQMEKATMASTGHNLKHSKGSPREASCGKVLIEEV